MNQSKIHDFLVQNVSTLNGVGIKTKKLLKKKKIEKISDLLWNLPQGFTDRSNLQTLDKLEIGKITTVKVKVLKYKRRKQYRRLLGHRQSYTAVQINSIKV